MEPSTRNLTSGDRQRSVERPKLGAPFEEKVNRVFKEQGVDEGSLIDVLYPKNEHLDTPTPPVWNLLQ